jgi:hypothetical protein
MTYEVSRTPKIVGRIVAALLILPIFAVGVADVSSRMKVHFAASHAKQAMAFCEEEYDLKAEWVESTRFLTFDAEHRYFFATSREQLDFINCVAERAPDHFSASTFSDNCEVPAARAVLSRFISGRNYSPSVEIFEFHVIKCTNGVKQADES